jgi:hypothetical protein
VMSYLLGKTFLSNLYNQTSPRLKFSLLEIIWFCGTHIYFSKKNKWVEVIIIINMRVFLSYCSMFFSTKNGSENSPGKLSYWFIPLNYIYVWYKTYITNRDRDLAYKNHATKKELSTFPLCSSPYLEPM